MNIVKTTFLLTGLTVLLVLIGSALGGTAGMVLALVVAGAMNLGSYWFSDRMVLRMNDARAVDRDSAPKLYRLVEELVQNAGLPMPAVYIVDAEAPNAFATGRNPEHAAVAVTTGLLRTMSREEMKGVLAHELAHVRHRDTLISALAATIAGAVAMIANIAQFAMLFGGMRGEDDEGPGGMIGSLLLLIVAPIAASLIQLAISRSREFGADAGGAEIAGSPDGLASALAKLESANRQQPVQSAEKNPATAHLFIVNPLSAKGFSKLFATHPSTEERIARLHKMGQSYMRV
ncbi:zinc metalloprotease HtpX [Salinisphaera sp. USBA-960]|uniref:zinc metalloprotease HtpX n=1 Tax=Salinisphaera orenii TaxID=856731 RepID=UPI000DBE4336|nr:zinc metalloprotease HtpX [Salifodinibacter halophilus]NNC26061.1 zinc metalloprotease HtpX [Salifodinibacter halophilus]